MKENKYIKLLAYFRDCLETEKAHSRDEIFAKMDELGIRGALRKSLYLELFDPDRQTGDDKYLTLEPYFKLLEYEELQQARSDSRQARKEAKTATWIAIPTLLISIIMSSMELLSSS